MNPQSLSFLLAAILITGCGGGGGGNDNTTDPQTQSPGAQTPAPSTQTPAPAEVSAVYRSRLDTIKQTEFPFAVSASLAGDTVLNGHTLTSLANSRLKIDMRSLPQGWYTGVGTNILRDGSIIRVPAHIRSYQGFYGGIYLQEADDGVRLKMNYGVEPLIADLPNSGKATYNGVAFDADDRGSFTYHLDFASNQGHGSISGIREHGNITLHSTTFTRTVKDDFVIYQTTNGRATGSNGDYLSYIANVWGPGGAEINGRVQHFGNTTTVFHGARGELAP